MEHRQSSTISVVVTDIVGSTSLAERLGPNRYDSLRREHFATVRRAVAATGGTEVKNLGDGLLVVYASARDALDGAIALQRGVDAAARTGAESVTIRVGVAAGDAFVEDGDYFGIPVVEAARLCTAARGGQILTTTLVRMLADRTAHRLSPAGELELKGLSEPVEAWEVAWEVAVVGHDVPLPGRLARPVRYAFVGREREQTRLLSMLDEAAAGEARLAMLFGEPGIGKTSLVGEVARTAGAQQAIVLYGRCDEELGRPYQPFMECFDHLVTHAPQALLDDHVERHGGDLLNHLPGSRARLRELPGPADRDPDAERDALFAAAVDLLARASGYAPIVLVLDDVHWADRPTMLLLRHVVLSEHRARVLLLTTAREDEVSATALAEIGPTLHRGSGVERLSLRRLEAADTRALVEAAAGHDLGLAGVSDVVHRESGGNPFFAVELLRHLAESGMVVRDEDGQWVQARAELDLPDNIRDVVAHRIARLGDDVARILAAGAVLGRDVELRLLENLADTGSDAILDAFERAEAALLVHEVPGQPGWFTFSHAIVQHTLYDGLSATRRARMHRRAAEALERLHPTGRTAERAHHWMVTAAGGDPDDRRRAAAAAEAAGAEAAERLAPDEACRWYGRALELRDGDDERTLGDLLLALGAAQRQAGQPAFRDTLLRAARLGHDAGDTELLVAAARLNNRGIQSGLGTVDDDRVEVLRWALDAVPADDDGNRAHLLALLALEQLYGLGYEQRAALVAEAVARARRAGEETLLRVLNLVHNAVKSPRSLPERVQTTAEALALSDRLGEPVDRYWAIDQRVRTLGEVGDLAEIDRLLDEAEGLARTLARPVLLYMVSMHRTCRAILGGDLDKAESWAEATHQVGIDSGQPEARAMFGAHLLRIRREQGRGDEVIDLLEAVAAANETLAALRGSLANLHVVSGDRDRAVALLQAQDALGYESIHEDNLWVSAMAEWGEAAAAVGDTGAAASILELVAPFRGVHVHNGATGAGPVDRVVGLLLGTLGRTEEAVAAFVAAEDQARVAGLPIYEAHALVGRARLLAASGDAAAALALAAKAIAIAEPLGAGLAAREAKAVVRGAG